MKQLKLYIKGLFMKKMTKTITICKVGDINYRDGKSLLKKDAVVRYSLYFKRNGIFYDFSSHRPRLFKWKGGDFIYYTGYRVNGEAQGLSIDEAFDEALVHYLNHQEKTFRAHKELIQGQIALNEQNKRYGKNEN